MNSIAEISERPVSVSRERFERIYRAIRDRICLIEYEPGARLAEEELAREFGVWLKTVPYLNLADEITVFRREVADILAAMELGDLESVGYIRRAHIAMWVKRMQQYTAAAKS